MKTKAVSKARIPKELRKTKQTSQEQVIYHQEMLNKISHFIQLDKWSGGVTTFSITQLNNATMRQKRMVEKFGNDNIDVRRSVRALDRRQRRMDMEYHLVIYLKHQLYKIQIGTYLCVSSSGLYMSAMYDTFLQDMCNTITSTYLDLHYPYLYQIFNRGIEVPSIEIMEQRLREYICYKGLPNYNTTKHGTMLSICSGVKDIPLDSPLPLGEYLDDKKYVMTD